VTARIVAQLMAVMLTGLAAWVVPAWGVTRLLPVFERSGPGSLNYRGRSITHGLGVVWLLWAGGVMMAGAIGVGIFEFADVWSGNDDALRWLFAQTFWPMRAAGMLLLVVAAFGFGLVDDIFGDRSVRGFRGHIGELLRGRLTTGAMKLLGIGAASALAAASLASTALDTSHDPAGRGLVAAGTWATAWVLTTLVIALSANLVNLMDLRPGRALKAYSLIAVCGAAGILVVMARSVAAAADGLRTAAVGTVATGSVAGAAEITGSALGLLLLVMGPVFAVWRHDLGERAMLGDAGANAAGALAGYLLASALPLAGLAVAAVFLLALNVASEKVSYTEVIESNAVLRWLDGLGRRRDGAGHEGEDPVGPESAERTAGE
jgi:hypothetical protein